MVPETGSENIFRESRNWKGREEGDAAMVVILEGFALGSDDYAWGLRDGMGFG